MKTQAAILRWAKPTLYKDAQKLSKDELKERVSTTLAACGFYDWHGDLQITGITQDGKEVRFFKNGNFDID